MCDIQLLMKTVILTNLLVTSLKCNWLLLESLPYISFHEKIQCDEFLSKDVVYYTYYIQIYNIVSCLKNSLKFLDDSR